MARPSKRMQTMRAKVEPGKLYALEEAIRMVKETVSATFNESVDVAINLGVDPRKSEQNVRGTAILPHGTGRQVRVAVFAEGASAEAAKKAGADIIGFQDLAERIKQGGIDFDMVIATPEAMKLVGPLGPILGPRGLMPNPKVGTVTPNVEKAVQNAKTGQIQFRIDKAGIVHCPIGKTSFAPQALKENFQALVAAVNKSRPGAVKGAYIRKVTLSTTMGPGVPLDVASL